MTTPSGQLGIDVSEFVHGFQIVDGRTLEHEQLVNEDGMEAMHTDYLSFDDKYKSSTETCIKTLDRTNFAIVRDEEKPAGLLLTAYIDNMVERPKIAWYTEKEANEFGQEANKEVADELREEIFKEFMSYLQISWKLSYNKDQLSQFWENETHERFTWLINHYAPKISRASNETAQSLTRDFIYKLNKRMKRTRTEGEEYRLIWSTFGLLKLGFPTDFPIIKSTHDRDDLDQYKTICSAIGNYLFWSLTERVRRETATDGEEPSAESRGVDFSVTKERDFSEWEKMARDGSAEIWLNMSYNNFQYTDDDGKVHQQIYRKATDSNELRQSIDVGTKVLKFLVDLTEKGTNLKTYRINRPAKIRKLESGRVQVLEEKHKTHGMTLPNYIKYLGGKLVIQDKQVEIDGYKMNCKKYSDQILLDYQYKQLWKAFWAIYNAQNPSVIP